MWTKLVDLKREPKKDMPLYDSSPMGGNENPYPWGLQITLEKEDLEKLGLECDCDIGDMIDMRCFAEVVGVNIDKSGNGDSASIRLQIQRIAVENEMSEEAPEESE